MRRLIIQACFVGILCFALYAPALEARECQGQSDVPLVNLLPPPPCETCPEAKAEMDELASLERERTPEQENQVASDVKRSVDRFLEGAGIAYEPEKLRPCEKFFTKTRQEEKAAVEAAKDTFCRTRPFKTPGQHVTSRRGGTARTTASPILRDTPLMAPRSGSCWRRCFRKRERKSIAGSRLCPRPNDCRRSFPQRCGGR